MNKGLRIAFSVVVWCLLAAYLVFAVRKCDAGQGEIALKEVRIRILDNSNIRLVSTDDVARWIRSAGHDIADSLTLRRLDTDSLERFIEGHLLVSRARVYSDMRGVLHVDVSQRRPVMRIMSVGYDCYISDDGFVLQASRAGAVDVPVVTGSFPLPFTPDYEGSIAELEGSDPKNYGQSNIYLTKLINFVRLVRSDSFWNAQIVQIDIDGRGSSTDGEAVARWKEPEVEIVPRIGNHTVIFGTLDDKLEDAAAKLDKLLLFYREVLNHEGWDTYQTINLRYKNQVVCRR